MRSQAGALFRRRYGRSAVGPCEMTINGRTRFSGQGPGVCLAQAAGLGIGGKLDSIRAKGPAVCGGPDPQVRQTARPSALLGSIGGSYPGLQPGLGKRIALRAVT